MEMICERRSNERMDKRGSVTRKTKIFLTICRRCWLFWCSFNILISLGNQSIQAEVGERQQVIAQTIQLETLNRQLITVLASLAVKTNDEQLKKVLADSGVNLGTAGGRAGEKVRHHGRGK